MALSSDSAYVQVNVKYKVEGLDNARKSAKRAAGAFLDFGKILRQVGQSLIAFKAVDLVRQSIMRITTEMIRSNAQFEKFEIQLKVFTGSAKEAASLIDYLAFQSTKLAGGLEDLLGGATALATFGIDIRETLTLIADIATATNRTVEDVAIAFGRIVAGDPRTKQFLVTRRGDIAIWNKQLAEGKSRLEAATAAFNKFAGVSEAMEGTFFRLAENLGDFLFLIAKFVGEPAFEQMKTWMKDITDFLREEIFTKEKGIKEDNIFAVLRISVDLLTKSLEIYFKAIQKVHKFQKAIGMWYIPGLGVMPAPWGLDKVMDFISPREREKPGIPMPYLEWELEQRFKDLKLSYEKIVEGERREAYRPREEEFAGRGLIPLEMPKIFKGFPRAYADLMQMTGGDPKKAMDQAQEMWDDIAMARVSGEMQAYRAIREIDERRREDLLEEMEDIREKRLRAEEDLFHRRYQMARTLTDRAVNDLGFIFFGGRGANRVIDDRIARLREEVDVLNGISAPLTRQEQLLNSIVELESQRLTVNQQLRSVVGDLLADITKAAAKAGILTAIGYGGPQAGGGGFMNLFKGFLGLGSMALSFVPGAQPLALAAGAASVAIPGSGGVGVQGAFGGEGVVGALRKPVVVNQPIFLSDDVRGVAERFADEASRRMR